MAWTSSDVATLEAAIRQAVNDGSWRAQTVQFADQSVTLVTLKEAMDLLERMKSSAAAAAGTSTRYLVSDKGV